MQWCFPSNPKDGVYFALLKAKNHPAEWIILIGPDPGLRFQLQAKPKYAFNFSHLLLVQMDDVI